MPKLKPETAAARKIHILEAAFTCFSRNSYQQTTTDDIVQEAGLSKGSVYSHFSSKFEIFKEMFLVLSQRDATQLKELVKESASIEERLENLFHFVREGENEILQFIFLTYEFYQLREANEDDDFIRTTVANYREAMMALSGLPRDLALMVYSTIDGLIMQRFFAPDQVDLDAQLVLLKKMIINQMEAYSEG